MRAKLKITLSYNPGSNPVSPHFKQIQLNIDCGKESLWCEQPVWNFDQMSFEHSQTPNVVTTFVYPLQRMVASSQINISLTYQQIKDPSKQQGTLRSAAQSLEVPFSFQVSLNPDVEKGNEKCKIQITLDKAAPPLPHLFPEVCKRDQDLDHCKR